MKPSLGLLLILALLCVPALADRVGDHWVRRLGDLSPGVTYNDVTKTATGRLIAVGNGGQLMISDDGGTTWTFRLLESAGIPERGNLTAIRGVSAGGGERLVVLMGWMESAGTAVFDLAARTYTLTSTDNGETWTKAPFPFATADFGGTTFKGVNLSGLEVTPAGQLLAYGTTTVTDNLVIYWSFGGIIYRSPNGVTWEQTKFAYGPIRKIADAGGSLVATGFTTMLQSADGSAWDGYFLRDVTITGPGGPLDTATKNKLRVFDIAVQGGTYVAHAATFVPWDDSGLIDSSTVDKLFTLTSPAPFSGARSWTAYQRTIYYGRLFPTSTGLLGIGDSLWRSSNLGQSFSVADSSVSVPTGTVARSASNTLVAVGYSNVAWRSSNDGASWSKVWNLPTTPYLFAVGKFSNLLFAGSGNDLWTSKDNGNSWQFRAAGSIPYSSTNMVQVGGRLVRATSTAEKVSVSDDAGLTWSPRPVSTNTAGATVLTVTSTGRLILPAVSGSFKGETQFYTSDDAGDTWTARTVPQPYYGDTPMGEITTASGRVLVFVAVSYSFNYYLLKSDDNGVTWTKDDTLSHLNGLDTATNDPAIKILGFKKILLSPTGRILILGGSDEIVTSDDNGDTWAVRVNLDPPGGTYLSSGLSDLVRSGSRWVGIGTYKTQYPESRRITFSLTSDDDGTTWRMTPIPLQQSTTYMEDLLPGLDGRVVAVGSSGAVYTSDGDVPPPPTAPPVMVREGTTEQITIARPPIPGAVTARYSAVEGTALSPEDFQPAAGNLEWSATDTAAKTIHLVTTNDSTREPDEKLTLQLSFEASGLAGTAEIPVVITDDDGGNYAGISIEGADTLYTTEQGGTAPVKVALTKAPTANVTLAITGAVPTEGTLSTKSLTFTPANWNVQQSVIVTGVDDAKTDGDASYTLKFTATSTDTAYTGIAPGMASVVNIGDEPYKLSSSPAGNAPDVSVAPSLAIAKKFTAKNGKATLKGTVSASISRVQIKLGKAGFKTVAVRGGGFTYKAKKLTGTTVKVTVQATAIDGTVLVQKTKILLK